MFQERISSYYVCIFIVDVPKHYDYFIFIHLQYRNTYTAFSELFGIYGRGEV